MKERRSNKTKYVNIGGGLSDTNKATISFTMVDMPAGAAIYYYDEESHIMEKLSCTRSGNTISAKVIEVCKMIFEYDELKECIKEDFERFYQMGFNEKQIFSAVLNEYEHGEGFSRVENICIHIFFALNCAKKNYDYDGIVDKLKQLMNEEVENEAKVALRNEYTKFITDLGTIMNNKL